MRKGKNKMSQETNYALERERAWRQHREKFDSGSYCENSEPEYNSAQHIYLAYQELSNALLAHERSRYSLPAWRVAIVYLLLCTPASAATLLADFTRQAFTAERTMLQWDVTAATPGESVLWSTQTTILDLDRIFSAPAQFTAIANTANTFVVRFACFNCQGATDVVLPYITRSEIINGSSIWLTSNAYVPSLDPFTITDVQQQIMRWEPGGRFETKIMLYGESMSAPEPSTLKLMMLIVFAYLVYYPSRVR
jgi:hypothetical protein